MVESKDFYFKLGDILNIKVKPKSSKSEIFWDKLHQEICVFLTSPPIENKANLEVVKVFKKQLKMRVEISGGFKSKEKKVKVLKDIFINLKVKGELSLKSYLG